MFNWASANGIRAGSGAASPVLADGRIYLSYYVPSPVLPEPRQQRFSQGHRPFAAAQQFLIENARERDGVTLTSDKIPFHALEKIWEAVDDIVLCLDAATGQTLWKAVMPARGYNLQHHKEGPFNMSPAVADGRVFAIGMGGHLDAFDAVDGRHLWTRRIGGERTHLSASVVAVPGAVIAPQGGVWRGYDPATGEERWASQVRTSNASVAIWEHAGGHYLLSGTGSNLVWAGQDEHLVCLDVIDGRELWRAPLPLSGEQMMAALLSTGRGSGPGGITVHGDVAVAYLAETTAARRGDQQGRGERREVLRRHAVAWRLGLTGPELLWRVDDVASNGRHVPVVMHGRYAVLGIAGTGIQVHDLLSGTLVAEVQGPAPGNGGYLQGIEDLLLVRVDGTHGHPDFHFYRIDAAGAITLLTSDSSWRPPLGGGTSSYHHPLHYPLGDGRLFLRMHDGIYAIDVRRP